MLARPFQLLLLAAILIALVVLIYPFYVLPDRASIRSHIDAAPTRPDQSDQCSSV